MILEGFAALSSFCLYYYRSMSTRAGSEYRYSKSMVWLDSFKPLCGSALRVTCLRASCSSQLKHLGSSSKARCVVEIGNQSLNSMILIPDSKLQT